MPAKSVGDSVGFWGSLVGILLSPESAGWVVSVPKLRKRFTAFREGADEVPPPGKPDLLSSAGLPGPSGGVSGVVGQVVRWLR